MTQKVLSFKKTQMLSCLFYDNMAQDSAKIKKRCGSSVVEHSLGKGEVESSILSRSTIRHSVFANFCFVSLYTPRAKTFTAQHLQVQFLK